MQIHTTARHCELDPADRAFAEQRLGKLTRFAPDLSEVHLTVTAESYRHIAEITLKLKGKDVVSRETSTEARAAIDLASDALEEQLRRIKGRRVDRSHGKLQNGKSAPADAPAAAGPKDGATDEAMDDDGFDSGTG